MLTDLTLLRPFDATRWVIAAPGGRHLLVNASSADLYRLLAQTDSLDDARVAFNTRFGQDLAPAAFVAFVEAQFGGYELLHGDAVAVRPRLPVPELRLRIELIPARAAARLSAWLRPFYAPRAFWASSALFAVALVAGHALAGPVQLPTGSQFWVALPLVYASMVVHEFGHVAATRRAGVEHGGIGVGLYAYLFPVLYADVTGIWLANKQERIIANLAGIHAQLLYAAVMAGGFLLSGYAPLRFVAATVSIAALWQFNPFVRHDGYWLLSDLTSTPNLLPQANTVVRESLSGAGVRRLVASRGRSLLHAPRVALFTYGVLNTALLVFFICYTVWHHLGLVVAFPSVILTLLGKLLHGTLQGADVNQSQFVVLALYLVLARYVLALARKWWQRPAPLAGGL